MRVFIEFKLKTGKRISVNASKIKEVFESIDGKAIILISRKENFEVDKTYDEVMKMLSEFGGFATHINLD